MAWAKNGTNTLGSAGDSLDITFTNTTIFNQFMLHGLTSGSGISPECQFDSDTGNYSQRRSGNGGADATAASRANIQVDNFGGTTDKFYIMYYVNIGTEEKLLMSWGVTQGAIGAGTAPARNEVVGKHADTTNQDTSFEPDNAGAGDYAISSNLSALGTD